MSYQKGDPLNASCRGFLENLQDGLGPEEAMENVKSGNYAATESEQERAQKEEALNDRERAIGGDQDAGGDDA